MLSVLLIGGLPGCGKTNFIKQYDQTKFTIFDDLSILLKNENLSLKEFFNKFIKDNKNIIITDPGLVIPGNQDLIIDTLIEFEPNIELKFIFFDNNQNQSLINSQIRHTTDVDNSIINLSKLYNISNKTKKYPHEIISTYEHNQTNIKRKHSKK